MQSTRRCGDCTACCTTHAVTEIRKPEMHPCSNLASNGGCGIYGLHPWGCRHFKCLWLEGFGDEHDRPDITGIVLGWSVPGPEEIPTLHLASVDGSAISETLARELLLRFQRTFELPVAQAVLSHGGRKDLLPLPVDTSRP